MPMLVTLLIGGIGGAIAFYLELPIPWLLGSLLAVILLRKIPLVKSPPKTFSRWMRIFLGVALGGSISESFSGVDSFLVTSISTALAFVMLVTLFGCYYFRRLADFNALDSFMSALPGGLTFLVSMSGDLGNRFPKIALIHTVRMVALILTFSLFAFFLGAEESTAAVLHQAFSFSFEPGLWPVLILAIASGYLSQKSNIAGGDIMFPMIIAAICYNYGWVEVPMPELVVTLAMITFGAVIGCKISTGSTAEYGPQIKASLIFTFFAISLALVFAVGLGEALNKNYFLFFLALAPGSIPEISLIAMALGFDVGFVALIHTCRYLFIMFIGAMGFSLLNDNDNNKKKTAIPAKG